MSAGDTTGYAVIPRWLQRDTTVTIYAKAVYVALSSRADEHGVCWPSHATIAQEAGCSDRKVRDALAELRALGAVTWAQQMDGRTGQKSNRYQVLAHRAQEVGGRHTVPAPPAHGADPGSAHGADERTPLNDHQGTKTAPAALLPADDDVIAAEWARLRELDGHRPGSLSGPARKSLQQLLRDGVPVERILQVIAWLHVEGRWWLDTKRPGLGLGQLRKHWATLDGQCAADWAPVPDRDDVEARAHAAVLEHAGITDAEWAALDAMARQQVRWNAEDAARDAALRAQGFLVPADVVMDAEPIRLDQTAAAIPPGWGSADDPWA